MHIKSIVASVILLCLVSAGKGSDPEDRGTSPVKRTVKSAVSVSKIGSSDNISADTTESSAAAGQSDTLRSADTTMQDTRRNEAADTVSGALVITSLPEHARIEINDRYFGETPYMEEGLLPGAYDIIVSLQGYEPCTTSVKLLPGKIAYVNNTLRMRPGRLHIISSPEAASIAVNDSVVGRTPRDCSIPAGRSRLSLMLSGYHPFEKNITATPQLNDTLVVQLDPLVNPESEKENELAARRRVVQISLGSTAVVSALAGLAFTGKAILFRNEWGANVSDNDYMESKEKYDRYLNLSYACYCVAGISIIGFTVTLLY